MTVKTSTRTQSVEKSPLAFQEETTEKIALEADYDEDRPVSMLAERQREFQKSLQGHYIETEMPPA